MYYKNKAQMKLTKEVLLDLGSSFQKEYSITGLNIDSEVYLLE